MTKVAKGMQAKFEETASIAHNASKGTVREGKIIADFLQKYITSSVACCHSGEIITSTGDLSTQCDVLIHDRSAPPLYSDEAYRILPVECLYGVIEVKSKLDSSELKKTLDKVRMIKKLEKKAFVPFDNQVTDWQVLYGREWGHSPTIAMIFAYESISFETLAKTYIEHTDGWPIEHLIDGVYVLGRGMLGWQPRSGGVMHAAPEPGDGIGGFIPVGADDTTLLCMTMALNTLLSGAFMPSPLQIEAYFSDIPLVRGTFRRYYDGTVVKEISKGAHG